MHVLHAAIIFICLTPPQPHPQISGGTIFQHAACTIIKCPINLTVLATHTYVFQSMKFTSHAVPPGMFTSVYSCGTIGVVKLSRGVCTLHHILPITFPFRWTTG